MDQANIVRNLIKVKAPNIPIITIMDSSLRKVKLLTAAHPILESINERFRTDEPCGQSIPGYLSFLLVPSRVFIRFRTDVSCATRMSSVVQDSVVTHIANNTYNIGKLSISKSSKRRLRKTLTLE